VVAVNSAIYIGRIQHRRHHPATHAFSYAMFQPLLDLDELDEVFARRWLWSVERPNLASMQRRDFHGDPGVPLAQAVRDTVAQHLGRRPSGPIRLLAHLRYFGYSFNPVSFYYGYLDDGRTLDWVLAEITNTPWRQRHGYVLPVIDAKRRGDMLEWTFDKQFHVSPFLPMQRRYRWRLQAPEQQLRVHMEVASGERREFDATLSMERHEIGAAILARCLVRFPLMTSRVMTAIHWQALKLWLKGVPVHDHPDSAARPAARNHEQ
jgi:uncharacterized protein